MVTPKKAYYCLILFIITIYAIKLLAGRVSLYYILYQNASIDHAIHQKQDNKCMADHDTYHIFLTECQFAGKKASFWPFMIALGGLVEETYSCIEYPCTELIEDLVKSWVAIIFASVFALLGFMQFFSMISNWKQMYEWRELTKNQRRSDYIKDDFVSPQIYTVPLLYGENERNKNLQQ